jgi:hypothetical protein
VGVCSSASVDESVLSLSLRSLAFLHPHSTPTACRDRAAHINLAQGDCTHPREGFLAEHPGALVHAGCELTRREIGAGGGDSRWVVMFDSLLALSRMRASTDGS